MNTISNRSDVGCWIENHLEFWLDSVPDEDKETLEKGFEDYLIKFAHARGLRYGEDWSEILEVDEITWLQRANDLCRKLF